MKELKIFLLIFLLGSFVGLVGMVKRMEGNDIGRYMHLRDGLYKFGEYYWLRRAGFYYGFSRRCFSLHLERCKGKPIYVAEYKILKGQFVFSDLIFPEERKFFCFGDTLFLVYVKENLYYLLLKEVKRWEYGIGRWDFLQSGRNVSLYTLWLLNAYACERLGFNFQKKRLKDEMLKRKWFVERFCCELEEQKSKVINSIKGNKEKGFFDITQLFYEDALHMIDWSIDFLKCDKFRCGDGEGGRK